MTQPHSASRTLRPWLVTLTALASPLWAAADGITVTGDSLPDSLRADIERALADEPAPETVLAARRIGQRAVRRAETVLNANGYYAPEVTSDVEPGPPPTVRLDITPGEPFTIGSIDIDTRDAPAATSVLETARAALDIGPGDRALPGRVIEQEQRIVSTLREAGYPDAEITGRETVGDRASATVDVAYTLRAGPPVLLGRVRFEGGANTKETYLRRFVPFPPGTPYAPGELESLRERLTAGRLFNRVQVRLSEADARTAPSGAEVRDVVVTLTPQKRNAVSAGVRFATNEGAGVTAEYTRRDVSGRADAATAQIIVSDLRRALTATWDRPHEFGYGRDLELKAEAADDTTDAFDRRSVTLAATVEQVVSPALAYTFGISGEIAQETVATSEDTSVREERDFQALSLIAGVRLDRADDPLDAKRGWRANARAEPIISTGDVESQLLRLSGQVRAYRPLDDQARVVAALRLRAGSVLGASLFDVPTDTRFFAGGGGSVRGYAYQSIGPENADGQPLGGASLLETSAELRWQMRERLGVVAFVDGGRISAQPGLEWDDVRWGAGLGLRYQTVAGPIRFDIAAPLDPDDDDDPVQIYLSVGQAF